MTDPLGNVTYYDYSAKGKLTSVVDVAGNRAEYACDTMGELITICQQWGKDILLNQDGSTPAPVNGDIYYKHYKRDILGNVETITNPLGLQEHYLYDLSGRLVLKKDREGFEIRYVYNPVGDIESIGYAGGRIHYEKYGIYSSKWSVPRPARGKTPGTCRHPVHVGIMETV